MPALANNRNLMSYLYYVHIAVYIILDCHFFVC